MFTLGKTDFEKYSKTLISWLSSELNHYPNQVVIIGHTDGVQFKNGEYSNWELSADRANATRRTLIKYGMEPKKILRVIGEGDQDPYDPKNNLNPANRRIEIVVLKQDDKSR
jgi:chemotaxis protein MotB